MRWDAGLGVKWWKGGVNGPGGKSEGWGDVFLRAAQPREMQPREGLQLTQEDSVALVWGPPGAVAD